MHSQINLAAEQILFNLLGKQALATNLGQRHIQNSIALGDDFFEHYLTLRVFFAQAGSNMIALPQR